MKTEKIGYWFATAVGSSWGYLWSTGRVERRNGLLIFQGMPTWTFQRGGQCIGGCYITDSNLSDDVLEHEAMHKAQWQRHGMTLPFRYLAAGANPLKNRYEIEAGLVKGGYTTAETSN